MNLLVDFKKRFIFLFLLSPTFWSLVVNFKHFVTEWLNIGGYILRNINSFFALYNLRFVLDLRSGKVVDRLLFNKLTLIGNFFMDFLSFLSPRFYFFEGPSQLNGTFIEYLPLILLPVWMVGVIQAIKHKKVKIFGLSLILVIVAFLIGQKNIVFLLPLFVVQLYFCNLGIDGLRNPKVFWLIYFSYIGFIFIRFIFSLYV